MKTVHVLGHAFDCLPGHITVAATGSGETIRDATGQAVWKMMADPVLKRKNINEFKITVVVIADRKVGDL